MEDDRNYRSSLAPCRNPAVEPQTYQNSTLATLPFPLFQGYPSRAKPETNLSCSFAFGKAHAEFFEDRKIIIAFRNDRIGEAEGNRASQLLHRVARSVYREAIGNDRRYALNTYRVLIIRAREGW